jgi:hypothetical protein
VAGTNEQIGLEGYKLGRQRRQALGMLIGRSCLGTCQQWVKRDALK